MSEMKFTAGPWKASSRAMTDSSLVVMTEAWDAIHGNVEICCVRPKSDRHYGEQDETDKANAQLIALAPEMVEVLRDLRLWMDTIGRALCKQVPQSHKSADLAAEVERLHEQARAILARIGGDGK